MNALHDKLLTKKQLYSLNSKLLNKYLNFRELELETIMDFSSDKDALFNKVFDCSSDALLITSNDTIIYSNQSSLELVETNDFDDVTKRSVWQFISSEYIDKVKNKKEQLMKQDNSTTFTDLKIITCKDNIKDVRIASTSTLFNNTYYIIHSTHDLSNIKKQKRIKDKLENNIAEEKFKVEFFANISHDLKTPINVIYGATQLQDMYTKSKEYDKIHTYNKIIKQNCLRLQKSLDDLLDITKIDSNYFKPELIHCNIISIIENITESITSYLEHKDISIIFDTNVEEKITMADPELIERILLNLISNGIKYGKKHGNVWVTIHDEGNHLIISVQDDGIGIPPEQLDNIFKRFNRVSSKSHNSKPGNGIGLSLIQAIIELLKGEFFCLSTINKGSEFVVILPMESSTDKYDYKHQCETDTFEKDNKLIIELSDI